ncbi:hypothetical protein [Streptomyces cucumeris]|uniref:hypothetical protein n=1 Tax=Streptomyces cucumeris TaxID=2962890 RepID=UPI0020C93118|nr:hypothetical protein [Streptomyces sp. NEAU-Y11]MCP9213274.1 hypothetical protein [Streptomyces sp. NEAU-Y11]
MISSRWSGDADGAAAVVASAQYGHCIAAAAFESARVPVSQSWQEGSDHLPILVQAASASR